jgi:hypothetical protein
MGYYWDITLKRAAINFFPRPFKSAIIRHY